MFSDDLFAQIASYYREIGRESKWKSLKPRLNSENLATDYGVYYEIERDLSSYQKAAPALVELKSLIRGTRNQLHEKEVFSLHQEMMNRKIRSFLPSDITVEDALQAIQSGKKIVDGAKLVFSSPYWGKIDLSKFNEGITAFSEGKGLVSLFYGLAILTGQANMNTHLATKFKAKNSDLSEMGWKILPIDWRRAASLLYLESIEKFSGTEGYKEFAIRWGDGDLMKAYSTASAIFSAQEFRKMAFGKCIALRLDELEQMRVFLQEELRKAKNIPDGENNIEGYKRIAKHPLIEGDMGRAYRIASAILTPEEFKKLNLGKEITSKVDQLEKIQTFLRDEVKKAERVPDGEVNIEGYQRIAKHPLVQGDMQKAHTFASAILSPAEFEKLKLGKCILLKIDQLEKMQLFLRDEVKKAERVPDGEVNIEGYRRIAKHPLVRGDMQKAYTLASAILTPAEFKMLKLGKQIKLKVDQLEKMQTFLRDEVRKAERVPDGEVNIEGYQRIAKHPLVQEDMEKAYALASAILTPEEFEKLKLGKVIKLKVDQLEKMHTFLRDEVKKASTVLDGEINIEGYQRIAKHPFVQGDMEKAYAFASAILIPEEFEKLKLGKVIRLKVDQLEKMHAFLRDEVKRAATFMEKEVNLERYKRISRHPLIQGDMQKAYTLASAILTPEEFKTLKLGKQIALKIDQLEKMQMFLLDEVKRSATLLDGEVNLEGYKRISRHPFIQGDMQKGYALASAILTSEDFEKLKLGKVIGLKVDQLEKMQTFLREELKKAERVPNGGVNLEGYQRIAKHPLMQQDMQKAYALASAILTPEEFKKLRLGKCILLKVNELEKMQAFLQEEIRKAKNVPEGEINIEGYQRISRHSLIQGSMQKAYMIASAILSPEEFKKLRLGKCILLKVNDLEKMQAFLREEIRRAKNVSEGEINIEGYQRIAKSHFVSGDMHKAYMLASAILSPEDFKELRLGTALYLDVYEFESVKKMLLRGIQDESLIGKRGWEKFAEQLGCPVTTARRIARGMLSRSEYLRLGWMLSPIYLAEELLFSRAEAIEDYLLENKYPDLIHRLIITSPVKLRRELVIQIVKWTQVSAELIDLSPEQFEKRALQLRYKVTNSKVIRREKGVHSLTRNPIYYEKGEESQIAETGSLQDELLIQREVEQEVASALEQLTSKEQRILQLVLVDEAPLEEAAEELGLKKVEAEKLLESAKRKFKKLYSSKEAEVDEVSSKPVKATSQSIKSQERTGKKSRLYSSVFLPLPIPNFIFESEYLERLSECSRSMVYSTEEPHLHLASKASLGSWMLGDQLIKGYRAYERGSFSWGDLGLNSVHSGVGLIGFSLLDQFYTSLIFGTTTESWVAYQASLTSTTFGLRTFCSSLTRSCVGAGFASATISFVGAYVSGERDCEKLFMSVVSGFCSGGIGFVVGNALGSQISQYAIQKVSPALFKTAGSAYLSGIVGMAMGSYTSQKIEKLFI